MVEQPYVERVRSALAEYAGYRISLLVGEPFYEPPHGLRQAVAQAATEGSAGYAPAAGRAGLRTLLSECERRRGVPADPENIVIGNGSKQLLFGLVSLLGGGGVVVPLPAYPAYVQQARLAGSEVKTIAAAEPEFRLTVDIFDAAPEGSCCVFGSPSNPTGSYVPPEEMSRIITLCRERNVRLVVDEVYADLLHRDEFTSAAADGFDGVAVLRSFSKSHGACGWRLGYAVADRETAAALSRWLSVTANPASTLMQRALEIYLATKEEPADHRDHFRHAAERLAMLCGSFGLASTMPDGGFYLFIDLRGALDRLRIEDCASFCERLARQAGIALWPGEDFGVPGWARLSFASVSPSVFEGVVEEFRRRMRSFFSINHRGC
jgi:aspartate/methionine/tyrosine aminotransferase